MEIHKNDVIAPIEDGFLDSYLDEIEETIRYRRNTLQRRIARELSVGDTIAFSDKIRPKYLVGLHVTVTKVNPKSVVVKCPDEPEYGRFQNHKNVRCPLSLIGEKV